MFWLSIRKGPKFGPHGKLYWIIRINN
jgi:hypothetical protein